MKGMGKPKGFMKKAAKHFIEKVEDKKDMHKKPEPKKSKKMC